MNKATFLIVSVILLAGAQALTLDMQHDHNCEDWLSPWYNFPDTITFTTKSGGNNYAACAGTYEKQGIVVNHAPIWLSTDLQDKRILFMNPDGRWVITAEHYLGGFLKELGNSETGFKAYGGFHSATNINYDVMQTTWKNYDISA